MAKFLLFILILFSQISHAQVSDNSNLIFDEIYFGTNRANIWSFKPNWYSNDLYLSFGGEIGANKVFHKENKINFIYGIETNFNKYQRRYINETFATKYTKYNNIYVYNFNLSNHFALRINIEQTNNLFFEFGAFVSLNFLRHVKSDYISMNDSITNKMDAFIRPTSPVFGGINLACGWEFPIDNATLSVKPEISFNLLPFIYNHYQDFFGYSRTTRLVIILRKD